ncbi:MAG: cob(I)yrinic acid a,c-diamide adenosyltransferase [Ruminococcus flavefaciens]|nr:cob(I)yrinic acid a,c-diamide adenosyltransferase [Ruminococcus flavefaciens]
MYHGNGKGKTTSAVGLAVRSAGAGLKVAFVQFLKNGSSSEIKILEKTENISVMCCEVCNKFTFQMNESEKATVKEYHNRIIEQAFESSAEMIILDEFLDAYNKNLVDRNISESLILGNTKKEIILTGRNPAEIFLSEADYISEIVSVRHPYEKGITARKGIEY